MADDRQIGDYYFNKMFPDQTETQPEPRTARADKMIDKFLAAVDRAAPPRGEYEFQTVKVPAAKSYRKKHARALEGLAAEGWEITQVQPRGLLQFGAKDTVTIRRKR